MSLALTLVGCASAAPTPAATSETPAAAAGVVQVAAASDLEYALDDVVAEFADEYPEIEVAVTYGSSGNFATQIRQGAPFSVGERNILGEVGRGGGLAWAVVVGYTPQPDVRPSPRILSG
jgi:ABC-type phosphate transport system substrate-binding protein